MRLRLFACAAALGLVAHAPAPMAAQTCYQDEDGRIVTRRRPGYERVPCPGTEAAERAEAEEGDDAGDAAYERSRRGGERAVADRPAPRSRNPESPIPRPTVDDYVASVPIPDRWRIVDTLDGYDYPWWDPYNRNVLKGDKPVVGEWFFNFTGIADSVVEDREIPTAVGIQSTDSPGSLDVFGGSDQLAAIQTVLTEFVWLKGDTVFRPPDHEFRFTAAYNVNYTELDEILGVNVDPGRGTTRTDDHLGVQALFYDYHIRNVSERYDFDSFRVGIQPFSSDFRGFLFQDNQPGVRLFGTRDNNIFQYNVAWFRRLEKDINSGLNDLGEDLREDDVFIANLYWQDMPVLGFNSQATIAYNRNREDDFHFDENGFIARPASLGAEKPREYDVGYVGYNGDGHFGRLNLTASAYYAFGEVDSGVFVDDKVDVSAFFTAAELSMDFDWIRPRLSLLYGSGDDDPYDDKATGYDAIFENPQFAGGDTSYWIRQAVPLIGGGRVTLSGRNGVLNNMRSSKEQGQSNFTNPGVLLAGVGADFDLTPELRVSLNANHLRFDETEVLEAARNQGAVDEEIGNDVSVSLTYRPFMTQNVVMRASYSKLFAGDGFEDLFPGEDADYLFFNLLLMY
ncbi:MAG: hypothetical protein ACODAC_09950 [Pseudomonadota bacterium]